MTTCKVCGANLNTSTAETCGTACERVVKYGETPLIARIRSKIAALEERCGADCPGWAVFNSDTDPVLSRCDECWYGDPDPLTDGDVDELPEAQHELGLAVNDGDAYDHPRVATPCACGCTVWRYTGSQTHEQCSGCGLVRPAAGPATVPSALAMLRTLRNELWNVKEDKRDAEASARLEKIVASADRVIAALETRTCPAGCDCADCRPELYVKG